MSDDIHIKSICNNIHLIVQVPFIILMTSSTFVVYSVFQMLCFFLSTGVTLAGPVFCESVCLSLENIRNLPRAHCV